MGILDILNLLNPQQGPAPSGATPPYVPGPAQPASVFAESPTPTPKQQLSPISVPDRQLKSPTVPPSPSDQLQPILPNQISTPDREKKTELWRDTPWYKDKNNWATALSAGAAAMGSPGIRKIANANYALGMQEKKQNKTMKHLAENNPEMFRVIQQIPPDQRGEYMKLAMQSRFKGISGENSTADIRNYEYFSGLSDAEQKEFLGIKRGDRVIKGTDGSVQVRRADGTIETVISPQDALAGTALSKSAEAEGAANSKDFKTAYRAARYADDNIQAMQRQIDRLERFPDRGGIFQPLTQMSNEILAEFGGQDALDKATAEQINESDNIRRTMQWFQDSGLGARGLDTPAEFMNWLKMNGGNLSMTNEASVQFLKRAIHDQVRNAGRYNEMLTDDVYRKTISNIDNYSPYDVTDPYALPLLELDEDGWGIEGIE